MCSAEFQSRSVIAKSAAASGDSSAGTVAEAPKAAKAAKAPKKKVTIYIEREGPLRHRIKFMCFDLVWLFKAIRRKPLPSLCPL